jgi:uncharacterized membrane protein
MARHTASIVIHRPPAVVYAFMDDVSREREWQPHLRDAWQEPPGPSRVGTRKSYRSQLLGKTLENTYVVGELEPGRRMVQRTTADSAMDARVEIRWEEVPDGTRVTLESQAKPRGLLRFMASSILESTARGELQAALRRLKQRLEDEDG